MNHVSIDFETFFSRKLKYSLKVQIAEQYCRSELFDPYMISATDGSNSWAGHPRDFNWTALEGQVVTAHNSYFEQNVIREMERRDWIKPLLSKIAAFHCTANMSAYLCNRRSLDQACEHLMGVKVEKTVRDNADGKHWADFSPEGQKAMLDYARKDAVLCWTLFDRFKDKWPDHEKELSRLSIESGMYGVAIDTPKLDLYTIQTHELRQSIESQIPWIRDADDDEWEEFNTKPTSTKCIAEQCRRDGIPCAPVKSDDEEVYEEWERTYAPSHPWIYSLGSWRTVNRQYKKFLTMRQRLRSDNTIPFELKYCAAHTGRWGGGSKINFQNLMKRPMLCNEYSTLETNEAKLEAAFKQHDREGVWPEWVRYAIDERTLIVPRPGMKMITSDLSQIEPRVLAWLAGDTVMLNSMAAGDSPYVAHARSTMGFKGTDMKKEEPTLYALAKARVLALGYQAGWEKFILMAKTLCGLDITKDDPEFVEEINQLTGEVKKVSGYGITSKQIVREYRAQNPLIVAMWNRLDEMFKRSIGSDFIMNLPSGRRMVYEKIRCETRIEPDPETKKPRRKSVFTALIGGKRVITYGGKLTENVTQAVARDVFGLCVLELHRAGLRVLWTVHDEAILEVPAEVTAQQIEELMGKQVPWLPGCTVAAEAKEVPHYMK